MTRLTLAVCLTAATLFGQTAPHWVGTWGCAPQLTEPANLPPAPGLSGNTLRQTVRVTLGGKRLRARFSNVFGNAPLIMNAVHIAVATDGGSIQTTSVKALAFGGAASVTVPAGEALMSDPFDYDLSAMSDLAVTIYFGDTPSAVTGHPGSRATTYLQAGNAIDAESLTAPAKTAHWYSLTGLDVVTASGGATVVVLGDSITDGRGSTTDGNDRWTDVLARHLHGNQDTALISVLNEGLGGNAVLTGGLGPPAVTRLDRDLFGQSSPRWLIVLEGVNDIGGGKNPNVADDLIAAFGKFIEQAHARSIRAYGVPILPFGGSMYDSPAHEAARQKVNEWIRISGRFDAVIDMDSAVRDPASPSRLLPAYDTGDHLHLNPAGYEKMGGMIDLSLFR